MTTLNLDMTHVKPAEGFDTIPAGWYKAIIDESERRPTKDGQGERLNLRFQVIEGQYAGRKVFTGLNIRNANEKAQEMGMGQLSAVAHAVGILQISDSQQLHNLPMFIKVKIQKDKEGQYEDRNEITAWKHLSDPVAIAAASATIPQAGGFPPPGAAPGFPPAGQQGGWAPPPGAPPAHTAAPAAAPGAPPPGWTPPNAAPGAPQWQQQPPAQSAPAQVAQPPHPAQSAVPSWQQPAAPPAAAAPPATDTRPPWQR